MVKWSNGQQSKLPFRRSMIVSRAGRLFNFDIVNPLSISNAGKERRPDFVFWAVGSVLFACAGGWRWYGAKSCLGLAEILPNVFGGMQDEFRISSFCC